MPKHMDTRNKKIMRSIFGGGQMSLLALSAVALLIFAPSAQADLVTNGSFESTTNGPGFQFESSQSGFPYTSATGWTSDNGSGNAYNFIFAPGTADTTGVTGQDGLVTLWGSNNGGLNVIPASSPDGGNFVAADADFQIGAISQTIGGLTVGDTYTVGFWWAAAQQSGFDGEIHQDWAVSLGSETLDTPTFDLPSHGFSNWMFQTLNFTANNTTDVLSFLAVGNTAPPFLLLDGVSMNAAVTSSPVPEPGVVTLMLTVLMGVIMLARKRRSHKTGC
jgi:hypothetical protein